MDDMQKHIDFYLRHGPAHPIECRRLTFEEYLAALDPPQTLPPRRSEDLKMLKTLLSKVIFEDKQLQMPDVHSQVMHGDVPHPRYQGMQTVLSASQLDSSLGLDYKSRYSYRDWTAAVEEVLEEHHCPKYAINFGTGYRVGFDWPSAQGTGGVFVCIDPVLLRMCRRDAVADVSRQR